MNGLVVKTKIGEVEGMLSADGQSRLFFGVPYAEPPVGARRFKRPEPKKPWFGVRTTKAFSPKGFQEDVSKFPLHGKEFYFGTDVPQSEDCLYLNIWAPSKQSNEPYPVMFWIHGGAFMHGCGSEAEFDGEGMTKKGVILVTINYRVGALGFFAHDELEQENAEGVSGNYGIFDQMMALEWVYENIAGFGGDPSRITVAGQSAGCMSTQCLISSTLTKGKISGAILQSGGGIPGFSKGFSYEGQKEYSLELMRMLEVETIAQMRELAPEHIANMAYEVNKNHEGLCWRPNADGYLLQDAVPEVALQGKVHDIPYMIGSTKDEMGGDSAQILKDSAVGFAVNQEKYGRKPVYVYYFERELPGDDAGAFHSCELWYEFETLSRCWRPLEQVDYDICNLFSTGIANFVKSGNPNGEGVIWPAYCENQAIYTLK